MPEIPSKSALSDLQRRLAERKIPLFLQMDAPLLPLYHAEERLQAKHKRGIPICDILDQECTAYKGILKNTLESAENAFGKDRKKILQMEEHISKACEEVLSSPIFQPSFGIAFSFPESHGAKLAESILKLGAVLEQCEKQLQRSAPPAPSRIPESTQILRALCSLYEEYLTTSSKEAILWMSEKTHQIIKLSKGQKRLYDLQCEILVLLKEFRRSILTLLTFHDNAPPSILSHSGAQKLSQFIKTYRIRINHTIKSKLKETEALYEALHTCS